MLRRWRAYWIRRGRTLWVPPALPSAPPAYPPGNVSQPGWPRRFTRTLVRRGQLAEPPWPQGVDQPPPWPPEINGQWPRRRLLAARRGRTTPLVADQGVPAPAVIARPRLRMPFTRRGQTVEPPWPQAVAQAPPPWPPQTLRVDVRWAMQRRGQLVEPPWPQIVPTAPAWPPEINGQWPRRRLPTARRGRLTWTPPQPAVVPASIRARLRPPPSLRRGRLHEPPWPQAVVQPSVWRPDPVRACRRAPAVLARRGQFNEPPWPQAVAAAPTALQWEGTGGSRDAHDATASQTTVQDAAAATQAVRDADATTTTSHDGAGRTTTTWEGS
jgi:hypothetical protein